MARKIPGLGGRIEYDAVLVDTFFSVTRRSLPIRVFLFAIPAGSTVQVTTTDEHSATRFLPWRNTSAWKRRCHGGEGLMPRIPHQPERLHRDPGPGAQVQRGSCLSARFAFRPRRGRERQSLLSQIALTPGKRADAEKNPTVRQTARRSQKEKARGLHALSARHSPSPRARAT
ncbi:MAG: hypothetical protein ACREDR_00335 [Blastocatellia bacterium]